MTLRRWSSRRRPLSGQTSRSLCALAYEPLESRHLMSADTVLDWNAIAVEAVRNDYLPGIKPDQGGPTRSSRALAIVHVAMYDAAASIDRTCMPYLYDFHPAPGTSMQAAVAQAAHDTLVELFPRQSATFDLALAKSLAEITSGSITLGVQLGQQVAQKALANRADDGSGGPAEYVFGTGPGEYRPDPLHPDQMTLGPDWGGVRPFVIKTAQQFPVPAPPALTSQEYAAAFNEVKSLGADGVNSPTTRTAEQTEIGIFWGYDGTPGLGTPPRMFNQITRVIAEQKGNTMLQNARLFAMVNVAMADAGIASWDTKFTYDFWRPITAIREAGPSSGPNSPDDGNPNTQGDPNWTPLGAPNNNGGGTNFTPPFPAYTSGHATFGAASLGVIRNFYGTDNISFTIGSDEFNGVTKDQHGQVRPVVTRSFSTLGQAIEENGQSRIYLGVHWSFDKVHGIEQGTKIADYIYKNFARDTPTMRMMLASQKGAPPVAPLAVASPSATALAAVDEAVATADFPENAADEVADALAATDAATQQAPFADDQPQTTDAGANSGLNDLLAYLDSEGSSVNGNTGTKLRVNGLLASSQR